MTLPAIRFEQRPHTGEQTANPPTLEQVYFLSGIEDEYIALAYALVVGDDERHGAGAMTVIPCEIEGAIEQFLREQGFITHLTPYAEIEITGVGKAGLSGLLIVSSDGRIHAIFHPAGIWVFELADPNCFDKLTSLCRVMSYAT